MTELAVQIAVRDALTRLGPAASGDPSVVARCEGLAREMLGVSNVQGAGVERHVGAPAPGVYFDDVLRGFEHLQCRNPPSPATVAELAAQIRNGQWDGAAGDIATAVVTRLPQWPPRELEIVGANGMNVRYGATARGETPVRVWYDGDAKHYSPLCDGTRSHVRGDGACFYSSVIAAMGFRDAAAFGPDGTEQWRALREAVADYVEDQPDEFAPFLAGEASEASTPAVPTPPEWKTLAYARAGR